MDIILDVKIRIAVLHEDAWYQMYRIDPEFGKYARSAAGITRFIARFTQKYKDNCQTYTKLFGKLHSIGDEPAVSAIGKRTWFYGGYLHRGGDLPAVMVVSNYGDVREWYQHGMRHRDDGPAYVHDRVVAIWYRDGKYVHEAPI